FYNIAPNTHKSYLPKDYLPYLQFSTLNGYSAFLMRMSTQNAFYSKDRPFSAVVDGIVKDHADKMEQMLAIRNYVRTNIHENEVPLRYMNYLVASPATVWNTNCGNSFEKNLLLQAMLQDAGFRAVIG
ncbi:hypothetical protein RCJ22_36090, partial [Vibrio sp. FNV 38]|nr:hypothetical protein [Vibrio sp. FNV 38]